MERRRLLRRIQWIGRACALGALVTSLALAVPTVTAGVDEGPRILNGILKEKSNAEKEGNSWFQGIHEAVDEVKGPATVGLAAIVPLTLVVGGGCLAMGIRRGMQLIAVALGSAALVLVGNGIAA